MDFAPTEKITSGEGVSYRILAPDEPFLISEEFMEDVLALKELKPGTSVVVYGLPLVALDWLPDYRAQVFRRAGFRFGLKAFVWRIRGFVRSLTGPWVFGKLIKNYELVPNGLSYYNSSQGRTWILCLGLVIFRQRISLRIRKAYLG